MIACVLGYNILIQGLFRCFGCKLGHKIEAKDFTDATYGRKSTSNARNSLSQILYGLVLTPVKQLKVARYKRF